MATQRRQHWPHMEGVRVTLRRGCVSELDESVKISEHGHWVEIAPGRYCIHSDNGWEVAWTDNFETAREYARQVVLEADARCTTRDEAGNHVGEKYRHEATCSWDLGVLLFGCSVAKYSLASSLTLAQASPRGTFVAEHLWKIRLGPGPALQLEEAWARYAMNQWTPVSAPSALRTGIEL